MKRYGNLYNKICNIDNLRKAHTNARRGKTWYSEVKAVDADLEQHLLRLQKSLLEHSYQTSEYKTFIKNDGKKLREIFKLPYYPDRICQWAILQIIEPILIKKLTKDSYSAIPNRGIHLALRNVKEALKDTKGTKYCLKTDIRKYYPSINHKVLKSTYKTIFKDNELLWLLDEIIDSTPSGIPIGNYLSQWSGNILLSKFDHWVKEVKHVKYYYRYMDDMVFFSDSKEFLHELLKDMQEYLQQLDLTLKDNYQVFPTYIRGLDFVGYRCFRNYTLLRKSTAIQLKRKMRILKRKQELTAEDICSINSYKGWLKWANCYHLHLKYIGGLL